MLNYSVDYVYIKRHVCCGISLNVCTKKMDEEVVVVLGGGIVVKCQSAKPKLLLWSLEIILQERASLSL